MGRLKKTKVAMSKRNLKSALSRWANNQNSNVQCETSNENNLSTVEVRPMSNTSESVSSSATGDENTTEIQPNNTGFALYKTYNEQIPIDESAVSYIFVVKDNLVNLVSMFACPNCLDVNCLSLVDDSVQGYNNRFTIICSECEFSKPFETSQRIARSPGVKSKVLPYDINRRVVHAFSSIGRGPRSLEQFSMYFNMKAINPNSYNKTKNVLCKIAERNVQKNLEQARIEVRKAHTDLCSLDDNTILDLTVSYDGSWHKRGFTSKYGIGCCIELTTGLVIDVEVISKYCRLCESMGQKLKDSPQQFQLWKESHKEQCQCNFEGSSPMMESEAAKRIWQRSLQHNFRYTCMISDGDSKTHGHLNDLKIYDKEIEKVECINHVAKRLGTGLRNARIESTKAKAPIGGKKFGSLKDSTITKLTGYYRNAIQNNLGSVAGMKNAIYATLDHCQSTDEKPMHSRCPKGEDSWCFFQRAISRKEQPPPHDGKIATPLRPDVVAKIMPLYQRLASDYLLSRCVDGKTQNANEALHGLLWSKCPKTVFVSKSTLTMRIYEGICQYNTGYLKSVFEHQIASTASSPGINTTKIANRLDVIRLRNAQKKKNKKYLLYLKKKRIAQIREEERRIEQEGLSYGPGKF